ncbi:hypothetical protein GOP47_0013317 [Adiantum capillus-veneris]|uniref:Uncharacterized protein n=1 Tax=Adiantum capillus-veneris TaxID=13818 RepID=A0A9D4ZFN4_ADICA|nr:hypothetical protein GOP47_0013317 [Adiantum capillus-veneris]
MEARPCRRRFHLPHIGRWRRATQRLPGFVPCEILHCFFGRCIDTRRDTCRRLIDTHLRWQKYFAGRQRRRRRSHFLQSMSSDHQKEVGHGTLQDPKNEAHQAQHDKKTLVEERPFTSPQSVQKDKDIQLTKAPGFLPRVKEEVEAVGEAVLEGVGIKPSH